MWKMFFLTNLLVFFLAISCDKLTDFWPPRIEIISPIENDTIYTCGELRFRIDEDRTVEKIEVRIDGKKWESLSGIEKYTDTFHVDEGSHTLSIKAWYQGGNWANSEVSFNGEALKNMDLCEPFTDLEIIDRTEVGNSIRSDTDSTTNQAPYFTTQSDEMIDNIIANSTLLDTIHATDPDGDVLTMTLLINPDGMALEDIIISWTPSLYDTGSYNITIRVNDSNGGHDTLVWTICVREYGTSYPEIELNLPLTDMIIPENHVDIFQFTGISGDLITLRVDPDGSGSPDSRIQVVDSTGIVIQG